MMVEADDREASYPELWYAMDISFKPKDIKNWKFILQPAYIFLFYFNIYMRLSILKMKRGNILKHML